MKKRIDIGLSPDILGVLREIFKIYNSTPFFRSRRLLTEIRKLQYEKNIRLLRYLLLFSLDKNDEVAILATQIINSIMSNLSYKEIRFIDDLFRTSYYCYELDTLLRKMSVDRVNKRLERLHENKYLLCLLSLHENGYIRENAIIMLKDKIDKQTLPFFLLRANDWVEAIRKKTQDIVLDYLTMNQNVHTILENLDMIQDMKSWLRSDLSKIMNVIEAMLINPENHKVMIQEFYKSKNIYIKRVLFDYLMQDKAHYEDLIIAGIKSKDPVILDKALISMKKQIHKFDKGRCFYELMRSKSARARMAALEIAQDILTDEEYRKIALELLCDRSIGVREMSREILNGLSKREFCDYYLKRLDSNNNNLVGAILGVGETGTSNEINALKQFLNHENTRVRKAALISICKLDEEKSLDYLYEVLCSDNLVDSRHATRLLSNKMITMDAFTLYELYQLEGLAAHVYENIIELTNYTSKWDQLEVLLMIAKHNEEHNKERISECIRKWYGMRNRSFIPPSKNQHTRIVILFESIKQKLNEDIVKKVAYMLR